MEKQLLKKVKPKDAAKELNAVVETVTCLECCKLYILPETAECGHTLCHGCWVGRRACPVCALPLKRRMLKANAKIQQYTQSVQKVVTLFEKQYNIKMEEYSPDPPVQALKKIVEKDSRKNVDAWLSDSQNQFSAPVSSQQSTQADIPAVEVKTCDVQVHTDAKKHPSPTKTKQAPVVPPLAQDDWDKIDNVPDTEEFVKNKENVGPMDIEPFYLNDDEYTTDHPRRSSRKAKHESKPSETSGDKHSSSNLSIETDKLSRIKQNWSNVKKMRKEFSKLHKKNKNKLNVSIEMCKKSKSAISKLTPSVEPVSQKVITIEECTPDVNQDDKQTSPVPDKVPIETNDVRDDDIINKNPARKLSEDLNIQAVNTNEDKESKSNKNICIPSSSSILNHFKDVINYETELEPMETYEKSPSISNIPFFKKSALLMNNPTAVLKNNSQNTERVQEDGVNTERVQKDVQTVNHVVNDNIETDSDDIQITIKIGSTLTNILIKKKKNVVRVNLNTDQEVQTCKQLMEKSTSCTTSPSAPKSAEVNVQNIEINVRSEGVVSDVTEQINTKESAINGNKDNEDKTVLTKKNTASDETVTVEISPSLEKELSKIMQCDDDDDESPKEKTDNITQRKGQNANKIPTSTPIAQSNNKEPTTQDIEIYEDIFASGSVKEGNVQLLKATKPAPSEVLMPTLKQTKPATQTQRPADKRNRENDEEETSSKKAKVTSTVYDSIEDVANEENKDESSINYDAVMGQVFASIDADMGDTDKSQSIINDKQNHTLTDKQANTPVTQHSQLLKTQKTQRKVLGLSKMTNATQNVKDLHQKDSESLFALSNLESQPVPEKGHNQKPGPGTQAQVESLLTPGMCRDLASQDCGHIPATPQDHDSDMSVCEETPQKTSFTRKSNAGSGGGTQAKPSTQPSQLHPKETELIKEIINISDTGPKDNDVTVVAKPKLTLVTPTINQFCNSVQHNSTPVARKSLSFAAEQPISSSISASKNFQELFPRPRAPKTVPKFCVLASCLTASEVKTVEALCARKNWTFVKEYTEEVTHLVVGVDGDGRSQRTVKYMCALAAGKWIVCYEWAETWMRRGAATEEQFEALDMTGAPGPRRARIATKKLFEGFTFYCQPPFSVLSEPVIKVMLESAGGRVASDVRDVRATGDDVRLLLAEPEHTQENQFTYMALNLGIVPVNYEWILNCLGNYTLLSIVDLMLCPTTLLPEPVKNWPAVLVTHEFDSD